MKYRPNVDDRRLVHPIGARHELAALSGFQRRVVGMIDVSCATGTVAQVVKTRYFAQCSSNRPPRRPTEAVKCSIMGTSRPSTTLYLGK